MGSERFQGLDLLVSAVLGINVQGEVLFANAAAENLLDHSKRNLHHQYMAHFFNEPQSFWQLFQGFLKESFEVKRQVLELIHVGGVAEHVHVTLSRPEVFSHTGQAECFALLEMHTIEQQLKVERESRMVDHIAANKELLRNLAHEIKNPLGGLRGAAQLLEVELHSEELKEYTQVIIKESDRLQTLVDRLLAPHRKPHVGVILNIHEVCERVRSVILAEYPKGLKIVRDYDISIPEFMGDFEQLIQALLNIVRNAAQALGKRIQEGTAEITLCTRVVRRVTLNRVHYKLALDLQVIDNGPGIDSDIIERIFYPLVSGREGGSGLGLSLAQTFVQQHQGTIECNSIPGKTIFRLQLPICS